MNSKSNRIVVFLGAGFPFLWGAPSTNDLKKKIVDEINTTSLSFLTDKFSGSFEDIIAALYSYSTYPFNTFQQDLFQILVPKEANLDDAASIYMRCINKVMSEIYNYEANCKCSYYKDHNQRLKLLFEFLAEKYLHISVYTTNYDEVLPRILGWTDLAMSLQDNIFIYRPIEQHNLLQSYSNLHGSIHLKMHYGGHQYEVYHDPFISPLIHLYGNYGGNPQENDLFSPIIVGHNKTQQILSKHFNYYTTCFANDLSDCETFLAIGSSFSDTHLNALIRQYTLSGLTKYRIITIDNPVCNSFIDNNISSIIGYGAKYTPDTSTSPLFIRENGRLVYYKSGTSLFLKDIQFWKDYL